MTESRRPAILLVYTGGTIGMIQDTQSRQLKPFDFQQLLNDVPELARFSLRIDTHTFANPIDSSDMHPSIWIELAQLIAQHYDHYDGFVILHGTDTMSYTASALSFLLENLAKPVILTGSQLPINTIRTDGKENLITAIEIAAATENGAPVVPEVAIYFEYKLYRGNRTRKYNADHFDAFHSPNYSILAEAGVNIHYDRHAIARPSDKPLIVHSDLGLDVGTLRLYPGISQPFVESVLSIPGLRGLVLETFGSGNGPSDRWFIEALKRAVERGLIILNVTQCSAGCVEMGRYSTSSGLLDAGLISGRDITTEAAIAKLMFLLGTGKSNSEIKSMLRQALAGEMTETDALG